MFVEIRAVLKDPNHPPIASATLNSYLTKLGNHEAVF